MRKGYLFIRGRTRFAPMKLAVLSFSVVVLAAAAMSRDEAQEKWRPLESSTRAAAVAQSATGMTCADFDNQAEAQAYFASTEAPRTDRNRTRCERLP